MCCPLPFLCQNFPFHFTLTVHSRACVSAHSTSNLCDELDVQTSVTLPKASQVLSHTKAGPCTDFHFMLTKLKCQSSILSASGLRKSLDVAVLAQLSTEPLWQEDTWAWTTLPSAKQWWYLAAAFLNVNQLLSFLFLSLLWKILHNLLCHAPAVSIRVPPAGANLKSPFHVSFQIMKVSSW